MTRPILSTLPDPCCTPKAYVLAFSSATFSRCSSAREVARPVPHPHVIGAFPLSLSDYRLIEFPRVADTRGNLTFIEGGRHIPFAIKRVYYLYDVPGGATRAGHAHKRLHQVLIAMSGSFDVTLDDGTDKERINLNRSYYGLYVPPMLWRIIDNFSSGSVCVALASEEYEEADYYRDYQDFLRSTRETE